MNFKIAFFLGLFFFNFSYSQAPKEAEGLDILHINPGIKMLKDSMETESLLNAVDAFLAAAQENSSNQWILPSEIVETQILIDEIWGIQKSETYQNDIFFKAYLTNIAPLENDKYAVHIAYIGSHEGAAILKANFELIAHKTGDTFLMASPLKRKTQNWKTKKIENHLFHYPYDLDEEKLQRFTGHVLLCDEKLKNNEGDFHYYMCKDETNPLDLFGVTYKATYNSHPLNTRWVAQHEKKSLWVANEARIYDYDLHDLWHNRLGRVISRREVHRRVDCHIAMLYGGTWGKSWEELFPVFKKKFVVAKNVDWLTHKSAKSNFIADGRHKVYTDDFVGALLVKKIEQEQGFDGVWKLLLTKRAKEEEEYFKVLEELTGITKENYNQEVQYLIEEEMQNLGI